MRVRVRVRVLASHAEVFQGRPHTCNANIPDISSRGPDRLAVSRRSKVPRRQKTTPKPRRLVVASPDDFEPLPHGTAPCVFLPCTKRRLMSADYSALSLNASCPRVGGRCWLRRCAAASWKVMEGARGRGHGRLVVEAEPALSVCSWRMLVLLLYSVGGVSLVFKLSLYSNYVWVSCSRNNCLDNPHRIWSFLPVLCLEDIAVLLENGYPRIKPFVRVGTYR
jgi:hypothetical protein